LHKNFTRHLYLVGAPRGFAANPMETSVLTTVVALFQKKGRKWQKEVFELQMMALHGLWRR